MSIMKKHSRSISAIIFVVIIAIVLLFTFIGCGRYHECSGECCQTCVLISNDENILKVLAPLAMIADFGIILNFDIVGLIDLLYDTSTPSTPVVLKVKLSN